MKKPFLSVHPTFLLLILIGYFTKTLFSMLLVYLSLVIHELGHITVAYGFGARVSYIKIMPFGIAMHLSGENKLDAKKKLIISFAGPLFSIVTGVLFGKSFLGAANLALGIFNLLPILTLDGGRMFYILISSGLGSIRGYNITKTVSKILAVLMLLLGAAVLYLTRLNISCVLVSVFLIYRLATDCGYSHISAVCSVLDYKDKKTDFGIYKTKTISVSKHTPLRRILKFIPENGICVIHILDDNQHLITSISEKDAVDMMIKYGAEVSYSDIK